MYSAPLSRQNPGCVVILVDRSDSMKEPWAGTPGLTLAEGAAQAINKILLDLCIRAQKEVGAPPRHYFDVGVFGYGCSATVNDERVEPALGGDLTGRPLVSLPDLATHPLAVRDLPQGMDTALVKMPIWVEPVHGWRTPMCQAIATAGEHVAQWATAHPKSFPPIVINITDGNVTDSPYGGADLQEWAARLTSLRTDDGPVLLFNCFLSPRRLEPSLFPSMAEHLPEPGPLLFDISSELPPSMAAMANSEGFDVATGARGIGFNIDMAGLVKFLEIGTHMTIDAVNP